MEKIRVAIDGPAGAGKSSVSKLVAEKLGYSYIDTGAIYRSLALLMLRKGISVENEYLIKKELADFNISFKMENGLNHIFVNGEDFTKEIRSEEVSMLASSVSAIPFVRKGLFDIQRYYVEKGGIVMEGRDIGTVIMPEAELKIFLTAQPEKRAQRRLLDLRAKGVADITLEKLAQEIRKRDEQDSNREVAPLKPAKDSIVVDNSEINLEETADRIVSYAIERSGE
jgi:CMP/dCMP kinase